MAQTDQTRNGTPPHSSDRAVWEYCRDIDFVNDEAERFLDLAGFVDARLDDDERERVAARLAADPGAAADIAAAAALAAVPAEGTSARIIARAVALVGEPARGNVVPFVPPARPRVAVYSVARWGSVAAAIVVASWLGFSLGTDASLSYSQGQSVQANDGGYLGEMLDPAGLLPRTVSDGLES
jgi:anti-sigma factor RsiW